ncbi:hypothetical protein Glove_99g173 [Diversispora epigaea]|uniref:Uncharacterized protein n=1 Tax=Diversispora epigaea TaxID=1348612 RepID=A0A397J6R7_9GLOM|nr:hypothetical protein Glove_99g173 [Diversispora epigaea]
MSRMRNRSIFASAIAGLPAFTTPSTSIASRRTRPRTEPTAPFVVEEEEEREATRKEITKIDSLDKKMDSLLKEQIDIKKKLKNIELLSEINNDLNFSKVNNMSRMRNRSIFASAIAGLPAFTTPSTSIASRRTRPRTEPTAPFVVEEEEEREATRKEITKIDSLDKKMDSLLKEQIDIKKKLKNIELLSEINNDLNFSKDVITRVTTNVFKVNIFPSEKNLKEETESVIRKSFPDIYESMDSRHHSSFFKKIKTKLLEKLRGMRGGIASRIKSAIFEIFGESQLPRIDFQSSPAEINFWKSDQRVKDAYRNLFEVFSDNCTYMEIILDRVWRSKKKISNIYIAWGVAIAQLFLNPKQKLQNKLLLKPGDGELEAEHTTEEESEEWEEEERSPKRRRTSGGCVLSPRLGSGSPQLASSRLVSPRFASSRLASSRPVSPRPVSPRLFESPDTPDTTREEGNTTSGDTEGAEIVGQ